MANSSAGKAQNVTQLPTSRSGGIVLEKGVPAGLGISGRRVALVVNRTGGQGKTLISQIMADILAPNGRRILSADKQGPDGKSKLGRVVPGTEEFGSGPSLEQAAVNPSEFQGFWDRFGEALTASDSVADVGANVIDSIASWASMGDVAKTFAGEIACDLVVPIVASPQSVSDAVSVIKMFAKGGVLPLRSVTIVENHWQGDFKAMADNADYAALRAFEGSADGGMTRIVVLPKCLGELLRRAEEISEPLSNVVEWTPKKLNEMFQMGSFAAPREMKFFKDFYTAARTALAESDAATGVPVANAGRGAVT